MSRRGWLITAGVMLLVAAGGYGVFRLTSHGDPDPDGRIFGALQSIESGVPADATVVNHTYAKPRWDSCDGRAGTFGWTTIGVYVTFETGATPESVVAYADAHLRPSGWSDGTALPGPAGAGQQWTRTLPDGTAARAQLTHPANGTGPWQLMAVAPPHGQRVSGC